MTEEEFAGLVLRYLDDSIGKAELEQLNEELAADPARVALFNDLRLHAAEVRECLASETEGKLKRAEVLSFPKPKPTPRRRLLAISFAAAAAIIIGIGFLFDTIIRMENLPAVATYVRGAEADFKGMAEPVNGDAMEERVYELVSGVAQIEFGDGADFTVEGPAQFEILGKDAVRLIDGTIVAKVPESAIGFRVETARATVRDLGTEFGVSIRENGEVDVIVFEGLVEVGTGSSLQNLTTGEGMRVLANGEQVPLEANGESYRFPGSVPVSEPKRVGENLVENHSFEIGPLSRGPYSSQLYRDTPSGWEATIGSGNKIREARETQSGIIALGIPSGGLPGAVHGERYAWINNGEIRQEVGVLEPGVRYKLTVSLASQRRMGPGSDHPVVREDGNKFGIALESEGETLAKKSGQLDAGTGFHEVTLKFECDEDDPHAGIPMEVVLSGKTRVFFDDVKLVRMNGRR